jgi:hypothetical protein
VDVDGNTLGIELLADPKAGDYEWFDQHLELYVSSHGRARRSRLRRASTRASLPLCALLKWVTTVRLPSECSARTSTRTADGILPSAAYEPERRSAATASGNAIDGRNDVIFWMALSSGSYRVQIVKANRGSFGEYTLSVQGATGGPYPFNVASTTPAAGAKLHRAPASITVVLDHAVRLDSVAAGDLVVDGQFASTATVIDDHTIAFAVPAISTGPHVMGIADLVDLQDVPLTGTTFGFSVAR